MEIKTNVCRLFSSVADFDLTTLMQTHGLLLFCVLMSIVGNYLFGYLHTKVSYLFEDIHTPWLVNFGLKFKLCKGSFLSCPRAFVNV